MIELCSGNMLYMAGQHVGDHPIPRSDRLNHAEQPAYQIGPFTVEPASLLISLRGKPIQCGRRAVSVLLMLLGRPGQLVTKDEILWEAWDGLAVEENNLTVQIAALRRVLASEPGCEGWIETLPRRGYRFVGPVDHPNAATGAIQRRRPGRSLPDGVPTLAILPFRVPGQDTIPASFAAGLAEEIVSSLAGLRDVTVISNGVTLALGYRMTDPSEAGTLLGARYVVTGALLLVAERLRVIAELTDTETAAVLWSQRFEAQDSMLFDAQDSIVAQIVHTLAPQVRQAELDRIRTIRPANFAAYQLVLLAREQTYSLIRKNFDKAEELLLQAMALDPGHPAAHVLAAEWHSLRIGQGWSHDVAEDADAIDRHAAAALSRDATNARALAFFGHNKSYLRRDYDEALTLFDQAIDAGPNNVAAWGWSSPTFSYLGDGETAIRRAQRALDLSPFDPFAFQYQHFVSIGHYTNGDYEAAARWGLRAMRTHPTYTSNLRFTAAAMVALGQIEHARRIGLTIRALEPHFHVKTLVANHPYQDPARRQRVGEQLIEAGLDE